MVGKEIFRLLIYCLLIIYGVLPIYSFTFIEWVEFSPFEIGMPKYGTFMKSELFGSKFFRGQLVKQHPEQPLHFLQGTNNTLYTYKFCKLELDQTGIIC